LEQSSTKTAPDMAPHTPAPEADGAPPQAWYEAIKEKFAQERDLRLKYRPEGTAQYTSDLTGALAKYEIDPHADGGEARAPIDDEVECLFIGGGFSALLTAARLRERGVTGIRNRRARRRPSAAPGTGTAIRERPATCLPTTTCRCSTR